MPRITEVIETPMNPAEAYNFVADFAQIEDWDPSVESARPTDHAAIGVGKRYDIVVKFAGQRTRMAYEIVEFAFPTRLTLRGTSRTNVVTDTITFASCNGGTRITWHLDVSLRGGLSILNTALYPFVKRPLSKLGKDAMDGLAVRLGGTRIRGQLAP